MRRSIQVSKQDKPYAPLPQELRGADVWFHEEGDAWVAYSKERGVGAVLSDELSPRWRLLDPMSRRSFEDFLDDEAAKKRLRDEAEPRQF